MKRSIITLVVFPLILLFALSSCAGKGQSALSNLCENLRSDYVAVLSFKTNGDEPVIGECEISHGEALTSIRLKSPELLSGLSVEYDVSGAPSSVAIRFKDFDMELPKASLTKINAIASLAADDFISTLEKVDESNITEYELSEDEDGYIAVVPYGEAEITLCFSSDGNTPYSLEYSSSSLTVSVVFTSFKTLITDLTPKDQSF